MIITLAGLVLVALFAFLGYRRGLLRIAAFLVSLLLAGLLAGPLAGIVQPLAARSHLIPLALQPLAALLIAGLLVLGILLPLTSWWLRRRERSRQAANLPILQSWERIGGMLAGAAWGFFLVVLIVAGLHLLGSVEAALARASSPAPHPAKAALPAENGPATAATPYQVLSAEIDASAFAPLVKKVDPVETAVATTLADLTTVTGDPALLARFQKHPAIARFTSNPRLRELAQDFEITRLVQERRYYVLLDNPKVAAVLQDKALVAELRQVEIRKILREVIEHPKIGR
jgi:uncharacterized membrane protein required for colicin V production